MPIAAQTQAGLTTLDHVVIAVYLACMLGMGITIARRQRSTSDFFVGGRNMPAWAVGVSIFASLLSTITYLGMPGEMFRTGVAFLTRQLPVPLVLMVVWLLWIPFFMRLNLTSAYEYLERRFNYATRALAAIFCLLLLFGWISVVVLTASRALSEIAHLDLSGLVTFVNGTIGTDWNAADASIHVVIASIGLFSIVYTTLGGIRAVVWTDVIQFVILMAGALLTMGTVAWMTGDGVGEWIATSQEYKHEQVQWFTADIGNRSSVTFIALGMFFWFACTHGANQVALQRYFTVRDVRAARRSYLVSALASVLIGVILAGVGVSLMHFLQEYSLPAGADIHAAEAAVANEAQDAVFPQFISRYLPAGLRGLVVAALFAAAMSSIDSGANSASTILTVDFFRKFGLPDITEGRELRRARKLTALMGVIVVAATILLYHLSKGTDIITLCQKGFNCFLGPLGALFVLAMFSKRATPASVIPAILVGEAFGIGMSYSEELFNMSYSTHLVVPGAWLATILAGHVFAFLLGTCASEEQQQWMWLPIVRTQELPEPVETAAEAATS